MAGQAIRGVALGVVVTALAQTLATGIALIAAGVPQAGLLVAVTFLLCIAQIGPVLDSSAVGHLDVRDGSDHAGHRARGHRCAGRVDG